MENQERTRLKQVWRSVAGKQFSHVCIKFQVKSRLTPPDIRTYHTDMIKEHVHLFELLSEHDVDYTNYVQDIVHRQCVADDRSLTSEDIATLHLAFLESNLSTLLSERTWVTTP
jgi:hypothetical protein